MVVMSSPARAVGGLLSAELTRMMAVSGYESTTPLLTTSEAM